MGRKGKGCTAVVLMLILDVFFLFNKLIFLFFLTGTECLFQSYNTEAWNLKMAHGSGLEKGMR